MKILVVGMSPLPKELHQALADVHTIAVHSLKHDLLFHLATASYDCILIWSEKISYLMLKKILQHLYGRFPSLKILVFGGAFSSPQRASLLLEGVKDCVTDVICSAELLAKIVIVAQENSISLQKRPFIVGDFVFDFTQSLASHRGLVIPLNKKEMLLLGALLRRKNTILSKQILYDLIWDCTAVPNSNSLEVYVSSLRRKIEKPFGLKLIESVKGVGYRVRGSGSGSIPPPSR